LLSFTEDCELCTVSSPVLHLFIVQNSLFLNAKNVFLSEVDIVVHVAIVAYTTAYKSTVRTDPGKVLKFKVEILRS